MLYMVTKKTINRGVYMLTKLNRYYKSYSMKEKSDKDI